MRTYFSIIWILTLASNCLAGNIEFHKLQNPDCLLVQERYKLAIEAYSILLQADSLHSSQEIEYRIKRAYARGQFFQEQSNYEKANEHYAHALKLLEQSNIKLKPTFLIDVHNAYYHSLAYAGSWDKAAIIGKQGLPLLTSQPNDKAKADYIYDLGYINDRLKQYALAIEYYNRAIELYESFEQKNYFDIGLAYNNLGTVYRQINFFKERQNSLQKAKYYWEKDKKIKPHYLVTLYSNLIKLYIEYGDKERAREVFKDLQAINIQALAAQDKLNLYRSSIMFYVNNDYLKRAEITLKKSQKLVHELATSQQQKHIHQILASQLLLVDAYTEGNQLEKGKKMLSKTTPLAQIHKQHYYEMLAFTKLANISILEENFEKGISFLNQAYGIHSLYQIGAINESNILIKKANLRLKTFEFETGEKEIQEAIYKLTNQQTNQAFQVNINHFKTQNNSYYVKALKGIADFYWELFKNTQNQQHISKSIHFYALAAATFGYYNQTEHYNHKLHQMNRELTESIFRVFTSQNKPICTDLLTQLEANESQLLRLEFEKKNLEFIALSPQTITKNNLLRYTYTHQDNLSDEYKAALKNQIACLQTTIDKESPAFSYFFRSQISIDQLQGMLEPEEAILKYFVGFERIYLLLLTKNQHKIIDLAKSKQVEQSVLRLLSKLEEPRFQTKANIQMLSNYLIAPIADEITPYKKLNIIRPAELHAIPFEILEYNNIQILDQFALSYEYSLSIWKFIREHHLNNTLNQELLAAFSPNYFQPEHRDTTDKTWRNHRFTQLLGANLEAEKITRQFSGALFKNDAASIDNFIKNSNRFKILHLAMHAVLNEENPQKSGLVFQENDVLYYSDLYNLSIPAELVVLSACNTGIGQMNTVNEFKSLAQSLTYAGVRSNIHSLWEVPDKETAEIMINFYSFLKKGVGKSEALAQAKRKFLKNNPLKQHPYYWAGFVLQGDNKPIIKKTNPVYYMLGIIGVTSLTLLLFRRKKLR